MIAPAEQKIADIQRYGVRAQGREELIAYLKGKKLTPLQLIKAYCYDCMAYYSDKVASCENRLCPLYRRQPYRKHTPPEKNEVPDRVEGGSGADHGRFDTPGPKREAGP
ncbi:MAG: hypothetical protein A4E36_02162 [Methanoregulaceae archaeon PtaB.Bin009]|nr:MAG: hypothetical protein A4E36_02162 [Methanoregulaceae archaeon PtaB.Bin009]